MNIITAALITLLSLTAVAATAATDYDQCLAEKKALRAQAVDKCSGLSYLLDPSSCFIAQKALAPYINGRCGPPPFTKPAAHAGDGQPKTAHEALPAEPDVEQLKAENGRLEAENARLRAEVEQLRKK